MPTVRAPWVTYCAGGVGVGDGGLVVGDATGLLLFPALSTLNVLSVLLQMTLLAGVVLPVLASLVMPTVRMSQEMLWWMAFLVVV